MTLKTVQRVGTGLMVTIALSVQPLQYSLLRGVGQALAATCVPSPTNKCAVVDPDPPAPATPQVQYFLLPGIGDGGPKTTSGIGYESGYFDPTNLPQFLTNTGQAAVTVSAFQPWADWRNKNLTIQGGDLASTISSVAAGDTKAILIGHSMGGLRGRSALQFNNTNYPNLQTKVKALVTLGTPHFGAPIIEKGKPAATLLGGVFGVALSGFVGLGPYLPGAVGMFGARAWAASIIDTPSGQDMRPNGNSAFLNRLNSGAEKVPAGVALLRVSGLNSNIDSYGASAGIAPSTAQVGALRSNVGNVLFVAGAVAMGMAFFTFGATIPWALALFAAAYLLLNLPAFWRNNVMGAATGDGVVPQTSQSLPANIGGQQLVSDLDLPFSVHTGRYGEYQAQSSGEYTDNGLLQRRLQELQGRLGVPQSQ